MTAPQTQRAVAEQRLISWLELSLLEVTDERDFYREQYERIRTLLKSTGRLL